MKNIWFYIPLLRLLSSEKFDQIFNIVEDAISYLNDEVARNSAKLYFCP